MWIELTPPTYPLSKFIFIETNLRHIIIIFFFWGGGGSDFLSKLALDPPTHSNFFLDVWNFLELCNIPKCSLQKNVY